MQYERRYLELDRKINDKNAVEDIREYSNQKMWELLLVEAGKVEQIATPGAFQQLNVAMSFCGITGYPVHAFGRMFCKTAYRAWMAEGGVVTDEEGFRVEEEINVPLTPDTL